MIRLDGITVAEFAHPEETQAWKLLNKNTGIKKLLNWTADVNTQVLLRTTILGNCFRLRCQDMPELYHLTEQVCQTLDYIPMPELYVFRSEQFPIRIFAGSPSVLVFPDFILRYFDQEMLLFQIGRAVTALKAQNAQMRMAAAVIGNAAVQVPVAGEMALPLLADWSRKAALSEDRGGLLACQDINAAMRVLMRIAGIPLKYLDTKRLPEYLKVCKPSSGISETARYAQTVLRMEPWNNDRILELYRWYQSGQYDDILEEYE